MATRKRIDAGVDGIVQRVFTRHNAWQALRLIAGTLDASQRGSGKSDVAADKMLAAVIEAADQYFLRRILGDIMERLQYRQVQELEKIYRDVRSGNIRTKAEQIDVIGRRLLVAPPVFLGIATKEKSSEEMARAYFSTSARIVTNRGASEAAKIAVAKVFKRAVRTLHNVSTRSKKEARWHLGAKFDEEFQHNVLSHVTGFDKEIADGVVFLLKGEEKLVRTAGRSRPFVRESEAAFAAHLVASMKSQSGGKPAANATPSQAALAAEQARIRSDEEVRAFVEFLRGGDDWLGEQGEVRLVWTLRLLAAGARKGMIHRDVKKRRRRR